jgi:hypothetical protein
VVGIESRPKSGDVIRSREGANPAQWQTPLKPIFKLIEATKRKAMLETVLEVIEPRKRKAILEAIFKAIETPEGEAMLEAIFEPVEAAQPPLILQAIFKTVEMAKAKSILEAILESIKSPEAIPVIEAISFHREGAWPGKGRTAKGRRVPSIEGAGHPSSKRWMHGAVSGRMAGAAVAGDQGYSGAARHASRVRRQTEPNDISRLGTGGADIANGEQEKRCA